MIGVDPYGYGERPIGETSPEGTWDEYKQLHKGQDAAPAGGADETPEPEPEPADQDRATPEQIAAALAAGDEVDQVDVEVVNRKVAERIFQREDPEHLWAPLTAVPARDYTQEPIEVVGFEVLASRYDDGPGVYLLIDAVAVRTGEQLLLTCGAMQVLAKLLRAAKLDALPQVLRFVQRASRTHPDRMLLDLELVPREQLG